MARWCYSIFFFLAIQGSVVFGFLQNCDTKECNNLELRDELEKIGWAPTKEEQLVRLCPLALPSVRCAVENIEECVGKDLVELTTSNNKSAAAFAHGVVTTRNLVFDICTPGTEMRENYLSSISCFKDLLHDPLAQMKCRLQANAAYNTYVESKSLLGNQITVEDRGSETECMRMAYMLGCFTAELRERCGEVAHKTLIDVLKRYKPLKYSECTEENLRNLKTEFLDILQLEEERRSIFSSVFELRKRRK